MRLEHGGPGGDDPLAERVSVVVASRDRRGDLQRSLPRHEAPVVLVDNASTDGSAEWVREHLPGVQVVSLPVNRGAVARSIGVARVSTPYVAFADDDSWWAPGALARAVEVMDAHPRLAVLAARVLVGPQQRLDGVCLLMRDSPLGTAIDLPGPSVLGFLACAVVVRREAFEAAGGFDDVIFFCGEEERLALDLAASGWGLAYVDDVVVHHHPSPSRDPRGRELLAARNTVLTAVLRRPWPVVLASVRRCAGQGRLGRAALRQVVRRLPRALVRRRVVPPDVEAGRLLLDAVSAGTPASRATTVVSGA